MTLEEKIEQIKNNKIDCNTFPLSRFSHFTMQEQIKCFYEKIIEVIEISNESLDLLKFLVEIGISEEIAKKIEIMIVDGTFDSIINSSELIHEKVLNKIDNMVTEGVFDTIINENIFNELNTTILNTLKKVDDINSNISNINNKNDVQDNDIVILQKDTKYNLDRIKSNEIVVKGLLNENDDKRLTIEGEGNYLKLENSKKGIVTVDKMVGNTLNNLCVGSWNDNVSISYLEINNLKNNTHYTIINRGINKNNRMGVYNTAGNYAILPYSKETVNCFYTGTDSSIRLYCRSCTEDGQFTDEQLTIDYNQTILLEGDYSNKPIPSEYFEGMQSTFEDCLVTREMVDEGLELAENLGKYKYEVEVTGLNKWDFENDG